jgi:dolichyl-phosphate beta-glucosyltransferase
MSLQPNAGKGAAVQAGMLAATGTYRLMVDADGATEFGSGLLALATELNQNNVSDTKGETSFTKPATATATVRPEFLLGSRAHMDDADSSTNDTTTTTSTEQEQQQQQQQQPPNTTVNRSVIRRALSYLFHKFCVTLIGAGDIRDTQCGFKLLTAAAADRLFGNLHLKRWAFDTEIVFLSARLHIPMREVAVVWNEVDGSKLHTGGALGLAMVAVSMLRDMICVRLCYTLGIWKIAAATTATASIASSSKSKSA